MALAAMLLATMLEFELLLSQLCGSRQFPSLQRRSFPFWANIWVTADEKQSESQQGGSRVTGEFGIETSVTESTDSPKATEIFYSLL